MVFVISIFVTILVTITLDGAVKYKLFVEKFNLSFLLLLNLPETKYNGCKHTVEPNLDSTGSLLLINHGI
jgi:hypothetical protein